MYGEIGHYTSFYKKRSCFLVTINVVPTHTSRALLANMISVIKDHFLLKIGDIIFSALFITKKIYKKQLGRGQRQESMFHNDNE